MKRLLWIGDAVVSSGFAKSTHYVLDTLSKEYEVHVLGINYQGDPHKYPYPVYPCFPGGDLFGVGRVQELAVKIDPAAVIIQNDPWNFPEYMEKLKGYTGKKVGVVAVDGKNCRGKSINGLDLAIFWTKFGQTEAIQGGYRGPSCVIPLGVDREIYKPMPRSEARKEMNLPERFNDAFIVGNVNRNQPRKRLDLCLMFFAEWIRTQQIEDAYFYFHASPTGEVSCDLLQLANYYGINKKLILCVPEQGFGATEDHLRLTYNSFNVMLSTTQGEGFGLTTLEGMACGIPQIVPQWSALGELFAESAVQVPCTSFACTPNGVNAIGGVPSKEGVLSALGSLYYKKDVYESYVRKSLEQAADPMFDWKAIGRQFSEVLEDIGT